MAHTCRGALGALVVLTALASGAEGIEKPNLVAEGPGGTEWRLELNNRVREEFADWFDPGPSSPQHDFRYQFFASRLQAGVRVTRGPAEAFFQYQHTVLENVPDDGPGPGGTYFANTHQNLQEQGWLRQGWIKGTHVIGDWALTLTGGRQLYYDGLETGAHEPNLQWIKQFRVAERLIGPFDYTHIGRSFDGVRLNADTAAVNVTAFGLYPTSGGFEISAGRHVDITLAGLSATLKDQGWFERSDARLWGIYYEDDRFDDHPILAADNRAKPAREADRQPIHIGTIGTNLARVEPVGAGKADGLVWVAGQFGDWQSQDHIAWAYALEAGYQLTETWSAPWLRGGFFRSSGDDDPADDEHHTFFQLIPTARLYAQTPFFNLMNNQDLFAQLIVKPLAQLTVRSEFHWLQATESRDLLYSGGGATKNDFFGFATTPLGGARDIGYLADVAFTYKPVDFVALYVYYGHVFGEEALQRAFVGRNANYGYVEGAVAF